MVEKEIATVIKKKEGGEGIGGGEKKEERD